jgi:hypothetical protein
MNHVTVGTGRKSMLSTSKNLLQRRLRRLMSAPLDDGAVNHQKNDLFVLVEIGCEILLLLKCIVGLVCLVLFGIVYIVSRL